MISDEWSFARDSYGHKKGRFRGPVQILSINSVVVSVRSVPVPVYPLGLFLLPCILRQSFLGRS